MNSQRQVCQIILQCLSVERGEATLGDTDRDDQRLELIFPLQISAGHLNQPALVDTIDSYL